MNMRTKGRTFNLYIINVRMHKPVWGPWTTNRGTRGLKVPLVPIPICRPEPGPCGDERSLELKKKTLYKKALLLMADDLIDSCDDCSICPEHGVCVVNQSGGQLKCNEMIVMYWIHRVIEQERSKSDAFLYPIKKDSFSNAPDETDYRSEW